MSEWKKKYRRKLSIRWWLAAALLIVMCLPGISHAAGKKMTPREILEADEKAREILRKETKGEGKQTVRDKFNRGTPRSSFLGPPWLWRRRTTRGPLNFSI
jgi:hypothetical protein